MVYVKWGIRVLVLLILIVFFHYNLPQRDIARITDTYEKRIDFGENSWFWAEPDSGNDAGTTNRDVFFIQTVQPNGKVMVYRNEDTGWGWPPYLKFDTSNLQAESADLRSTKEAPVWVAITHYGWRNEFYSIYPNAIAVRQVEGPDVSLFPWLNITILVFLLILVLALRQVWLRFRRHNIDPVLSDAGDALDRTGDRIGETRGRIGRWLDSWRSKPRR